MSETNLFAARIVSSIAATCMSLACGTNYAYSAWAPQFAERLKLSSTQSNLIGLAGNFGMYSMGIPIGLFVDAKGPRPAVIIGAILLAAGYFPLQQAFIHGKGYMPLLLLFSASTGVGGCFAFFAAIKTSALNWPHHRGTATAFPLAGFGLSAFFFSIFSRFIFHGDTGDFLMLLATGTFGLTVTSFFFLRVLPRTQYTALPTDNGIARGESNLLRRTKSNEGKIDSKVIRSEPGRSTLDVLDGNSSIGGTLDSPGAEAETPAGPLLETNEVSISMSRDSMSESGDIIVEENSVDKHHSQLDIRGLRLLRRVDFWLLFSLIGTLTGIGLMTINNIGNDVTALWRGYDHSVTPQFLAEYQAMHVSLLSVCSFVGRLCSGVGSDLLVRKLHASRGWCLVFASLVFLVAQTFALTVENPAHLKYVSGFTGLAYGVLFGVFPSLVAEAFGVHALSQNWGIMTAAPFFSGNIFNLFYGNVYDAHSTILPNGVRQCDEGLVCYRNAYLVTTGACILGLIISLYSIHYMRVKWASEARERALEEHEA